MDWGQFAAMLAAGAVTGMVTGVVSARVALARVDVHLDYLRKDVGKAERLGRAANARLDKIGAPAMGSMS